MSARFCRLCIVIRDGRQSGCLVWGSRGFTSGQSATWYRSNQIVMSSINDCTYAMGDDGRGVT